jgi:2'-hydroxyisoflavone reductase
MSDLGRVVVLGGSRFIGRSIVEALLHRGFAVVTVNRQATPVEYSKPVERIKADRRDTERFLEILRQIDAYYLIDVTAYCAEDTLAVLEAFRGRLVKAVHISTLSVYKQPTPLPISEEWPLQTDAANAYGFHKAECERLITAEPVARFPWTILRLPAVFGPGDPLSREFFFFSRIITGRPVILPKKFIHLCQNVYVEDVANACCRILETPQSTGRVYNLGGPVFTLDEYLQTMGRLLRRPVELIRVDKKILENNGFDLSKIPYCFDGNLCLRTNRIAEELGFDVQTSLENGLAETLSWLSRGVSMKDYPWFIPAEAEAKIRDLSAR